VPWSYTVPQLEKHANAHEVVYPGLGAKIIARFDHWNERAFGRELSLLPVQIVPVAPYGHWIGRAGAEDGESAEPVIKLQNHRGAGFSDELGEVLLHEMLHQFLRHRGEAWKHASRPWVREVERLSRELFGIEVECAPYYPVKGKRYTDPSEYTPKRAGAVPLVLNQYRRWPHCITTDSCM
jgi:hypothetical protein